MTNEQTRACAHCGACLPACPTFRATGREDLSPRGRLRIIAAGVGGKAADKALASCLVCGACEAACTRGIEITGAILAARRPPGPAAGMTVRAAGTKALERLAPLARLTARAAGVLPPESGLRLSLGLDEGEAAPAAPAPGGETAADRGPALFAGCFARHLVPGIARATIALEAFCHGRAPSVPGDQTCCGLAAMAAGRVEQARRLARRNIEAFAGAGTIITPCASCYHHLSNYPRLFRGEGEWLGRARDFASRVVEFSRRFTTPAAKEILAKKLAPLPRAADCLWHDPCHLRFGPGITAEPRELLSLVEGLELREFAAGPRCCGMGGIFSLRFAELSARIVAPAAEELNELRVTAVITSCSGCLIQWQRHGPGGIRVAHPAGILAALLPR